MANIVVHGKTSTPLSVQLIVRQLQKKHLVYTFHSGIFGQQWGRELKQGYESEGLLDVKTMCNWKSPTPHNRSVCCLQAA